LRLFKMPTEEKKDDKKEWKNSKGKELLLKGLRDGSIPLDGKDMPPKEVYTLRPEFADYGGYKNFPSRLRSARKTIIEKNDRASSDLAAFTHDRLLYPEAPHNYRGEPRWDGSDAERFLKQDIDDGKHDIMTPQELYNSRAVYHQNYPLYVFRGHIYQEVKRRKFLNQYGALKRKKNNA